MNIQSAVHVLRAAQLANDSVIMEGLHGIGKSQIVVQYSNENVYHLETLFLSHQEVGDIIGIPDTITNKDGIKNTVWSVPIWLQRMHDAAAQGKKCVLLLDEINRAPIDVRQSAMQLVLEGKIHEHELPVVGGIRTQIVAAINPPGEYQVDELDPALMDRFLHISIEADAQVWVAHQRSTGENQIVSDFILEYPDRIHWTPADGGIGASPRSWSKLAKYMDFVKDIPEEILFEVFRGKIGMELASQFYTFYKNYVDVVKVQDIEKIVKDNKDDFENIEDLAELITELMVKTEAIQKSDLSHQLADKYMVKEDILVFLAYLYSLEVEICVAFLKSYSKDNPLGYKKLAQVDAKINNKKLFKRIVLASDAK
jgi:hypothetical protein